MKNLCLLLLSIVVISGQRESHAAEPSAAFLRNWPQWRGPLANGTALEGNPPLEWNESKNIRWKTAVPGRGSASPIVWEDQVFLLTANPASGSDTQSEDSGGPGRLTNDVPKEPYQFLVISYDRQTGSERWRRMVREEVPHEGGHPTNTFASGSPTTDGKRLYASFGSYGIYCLDLSGKLIWERDLGDMNTRNGFGEGSSPTLYGDKLVVCWDHEGESFIVALNALTGETIWQKSRDEPTTWATPLVVEVDGRPQVVTNGTNRTRSYDLESGELLWECGGQATNPIPSPVTREGLVFCMTGYRGYAVYALPLSARGDLTGSSDIAWNRTDAGPYIASPVLYDGTLYFTKSRDAILYSVDAASGTPHIESARIPQLGTLYASPVAASGRIYFTDRDGVTTVIRHAPELEVLATNRLDEGIDASAAIVGNQMFLRGAKHLYCIEE